MSFKGQLIKAGIDSNGTDIAIFNGTLTLQTDNKLIFRDSGCYIHSNADGYLTIEADLGVIIAAPFSFTGVLTIGTAETGIDFTGTYTIGIDLSDATISAATTSHYFAIGTQATAKVLGALGGTTYLTSINVTASGDSYLVGRYCKMTTSAAMASGGFYGDYQRAYINHDIQDVYMQMGKLDFSAGTTAISPNQLCATMSEVDLGGTGTITLAAAGGIYGHLILFPFVATGGRDIATGPIRGCAVVWRSVVNYSSVVSLFLADYSDDTTIDYGVNITGSGAVTSSLRIYGEGDGTIGSGIEIAEADTNAITTGIKITSVCQGVTNTTSAAFQYGSYGTAIAYGNRATKLVVSSIHVSGDWDVYAMGNVVRYTSTNDCSGYWCGMYSYSDIQHDTTAIYTIRGRMDIDGAVTVGQSCCAYLQMNLGATAAITEGTGPSISGVFIDMAITSGAAIHTNIETSGIQIYANGLTATVDGPTCGIMICALGGNARLDYGIRVKSGTNSLMSAAIQVTIPAGSDNCELPYGIEFANAASGAQILHAFRFDSGDKTDACYVTTTTITAPETAEAIIKIDVAGTDYYIPAYNAASIDTEWTDQT